jgi:hypothetical protein
MSYEIYSKNFILYKIYLYILIKNIFKYKLRFNL